MLPSAVKPVPACTRHTDQPHKCRFPHGSLNLASQPPQPSSSQSSHHSSLILPHGSLVLASQPDSTFINGTRPIRSHNRPRGTFKTSLATLGAAMTIPTPVTPRCPPHLIPQQQHSVYITTALEVSSPPDIVTQASSQQQSPQAERWWVWAGERLQGGCEAAERLRWKCDPIGS